MHTPKTVRTHTDAATGGRVRWRALAWQLFVTAVLLACVLGVLRAVSRLPSWEDWRGILLPRRWPALALLGLGMLTAIALRGLRWGVMVSGYISGSPVSHIPRFAWFFLLSVFSPFRLAELLRIAYYRREGGGLTRGTAVVFLERAQDMMALLAMLAAGLLIAGDVSFLTGPVVMSLLVGLVFFYAFFLLAGLSYARFRRRGHPSDAGVCLPAWKRMARDVLLCASETSRNLLAMVCGLGSWVALLVCYHVALGTFFPSVSPAAALLMLALVNLGGLLNIGVANVGMYQAASIIALAPFGISEARALVASFAMQGMVLVVVAATGTLSRLVIAVGPPSDGWSGRGHRE